MANLLDSDAQYLVNPVNCVGVMGKGLALQFKQRFPAMFTAYEKECAAGIYTPGSVHTYLVPVGDSAKWVLNVATKDHWKDPSRLEWVDEGVKMISRLIPRWPIRSIAIPPLGCGLGGLDWIDVESLLHEHLAGLDCHVTIYPPGAEPYVLSEAL